MRISDWSSDVCSSDLHCRYDVDLLVGGAENAAEQIDVVATMFGGLDERLVGHEDGGGGVGAKRRGSQGARLVRAERRMAAHDYLDRLAGDPPGGLFQQRESAGAAGRMPHGIGYLGGDRKSVVEGKSVSVRVDLGGRRFLKKKK